MNRRAFLRATTWTAAGTAVSMTAYTIAVEPHWTKLVERTLPVRNLPAELIGLRLMHLSDLHVGPHVSSEYLIEALKSAATLRPDIVVNTGDFLSYVRERGDAQFRELATVLGHGPRGRLATVGVLGNHDYGMNWSEPDVAARVQRELEGAGIRILRNEVEAVRGLDIIGVDDLWGKQADPHSRIRKAHRRCRHRHLPQSRFGRSPRMEILSGMDSRRSYPRRSMEAAFPSSSHPSGGKSKIYRG